MSEEEVEVDLISTATLWLLAEEQFPDWSLITDTDRDNIQGMLSSKSMRKALMAMNTVMVELERFQPDLSSDDAIKVAIKKQGIVLGFKLAMDTLFSVAVEDQ